MPQRDFHLLRGEKQATKFDVYICNVNDLMAKEDYHLINRTIGFSRI